MMWMFLHILLLFLRVSSGKPSFPSPLDKKTEKHLFALSRNGDAEARKTLITHNLRLVAHIAKRYYAPDVENDDLISIGTIGLIKAIDSYKPDSGIRFATYAGKCMQNEILMFFRSRKKYASETYLEDTVDTDKDGKPLTYMDIVSIDDDICEQISLKTDIESMRKCIKNVLLPSEQELLTRRYGLDGSAPMTQKQVANLLGISRSYVSRIEKGAIEKLREGMSVK